jgi:beta-glucosidase
VKLLWPGAASDTAGAARLRDEAVEAARAADVVVLTLGESGAMSGEAASRTSLELPPFQRELAEAVLALKKPTVVVLFTGRPLALGWLKERAPALLLAWFPGTEAGHALADVLTGKVNPSGKLPVTFPRTVGQVPIYYAHKATGRPPTADDKYTSKYIDAEWTPLYPFGYGLSYTTFELGDLQVSAATIPASGQVTVSATVRNTGKVKGTEVVQFYVQDVVASVTRPVQELRGFTRVTLEPGASQRVEFTAGSRELGFLGRDLRWRVEPGEFRVRVSHSSEGGLTGTFAVR